MKTTTLILVPTEFERDILQSLPEFEQLSLCPIELCGFGAIVAAARTSQLLARYQAERVILLGISGSYTNELELGNAYAFGQTVCYGVGVGSVQAFQTSDQMGWKQWAGDDSSCIGDLLELRSIGSEESTNRQLLTCTAASSCAEDVEKRLQTFPAAVAEDMEGFSVAAACRLAGVECSIVRGISNRAGDRDKSNWKIHSALQDALSMVLRSIGEE